MTRIFTALLALLMLTSCGVQEGTDQAEYEVDRFHQLYNAGKFSEIHRRSHADFQGFISAGDLAALLDKLTRTLGRHQSSELITWSVKTSFTGQGTKITLTYAATYEQSASVKESFTFHKQDNDIKLYNFNVAAADFAKPPLKKEDEIDI